MSPKLLGSNCLSLFPCLLKLLIKLAFYLVFFALGDGVFATPRCFLLVSNANPTLYLVS
jgi:hypothetical protein